ncbi:MAG: pnb [Rhodocyclaceae bacterium]|nr:MAG: pnb [Rhodocyclaceae bacterium]TND06019.1 MAG: pnb [Rhodocyclaceae bacterium]
MVDTEDARTLARMLRERRSIRDFSAREVPQELIAAILDDARWAPSWSNTQPYRIAIASGELKDKLKTELLACFDASVQIQRGGLFGKLQALLTRKGLPDGDFDTRFEYPAELTPRRRATGFGLYATLGIAREDAAARHRQMRRNWEFFGAPVVLFVFVRQELGAYSILDGGIFLQSLMLSAQARGLGTCAEGALATWAGPVREAFEVPPAYKLLCGLALGWPSDHVVNTFNPGRAEVAEMLIPVKRG